MKEHGSKLPAEQPAKILKSLLKKPGQSKSRSQKNRVVINEKLNEFFAADYIILIKEECCADYEEDCDCCCQEHELMRLGNCKECRAELNLHFDLSDNNRYHDMERDGEIIHEDTLREESCGNKRFECVELHLEDEDDEEYELEMEKHKEIKKVEKEEELINNKELKEIEEKREQKKNEVRKNAEIEEKKFNIEEDERKRRKITKSLNIWDKNKRINEEKDIENHKRMDEFILPSLTITSSLSSLSPPPPPPLPPPPPPEVS